MADFRDERIGIMDAARLLKVRVSELRDAIQQGTQLRGVDPPPVYIRAGTNGTTLIFRAGDVMDVANKLHTQR